ncbi:FYVE zinc finger [Geosmithia morbida]|uniref:RING-type E3 ubiquitin transferase n=1 Tax=Geosmithia morbida TaxID=1094350 RepID=A0A9P4YVX2_9HYPO|nr:FYVE zinc finger [Geosmithia morbida]KAF4123507.1 FYVE zinc finger [Geosmithia morbida]
MSSPPREVSPSATPDESNPRPSTEYGPSPVPSPGTQVEPSHSSDTGQQEDVAVPDLRPVDGQAAPPPPVLPTFDDSPQDIWADTDSGAETPALVSTQTTTSASASSAGQQQHDDDGHPPLPPPPPPVLPTFDDSPQDLWAGEPETPESRGQDIISQLGVTLAEAQLSSSGGSSSGTSVSTLSRTTSSLAGGLHRLDIRGLHHHPAHPAPQQHQHHPSLPPFPGAAPRPPRNDSLAASAEIRAATQPAAAPLPAPPGARRLDSSDTGASSRRSSDFAVPRWQPDVEVTYCPICHTQFNFFVRKHHCRKCGRVVCNACSPHRIIIPYQYIVRPPGFDMPISQGLLFDGFGSGYFDMNGISGGERVRLCNPCVPDPNIAPPQHQQGPGAVPGTPGAGSVSSPSPSVLSPRSSHQRSWSSIGDAYAAATSSSRFGMGLPGSHHANDILQSYGPRTRSMTVNPSGNVLSGGSPSPRIRASSNAYYPYASTGRYPESGGEPSTSVPPHAGRYGLPTSASTSAVPSSSHHVYHQQRVLPPTPQIAEEDECPICHRELPQRHLANFEALRESHITSCITSHSTYGNSPGGRSGAGGGGGSGAGEGGGVIPPRRTGMYSYAATEKDCIDDAECTICLEEFTVGVPMARLECLCRFHRSCISAWFVNHPGRCPVHQHDGFGY